MAQLAHLRLRESEIDDFQSPNQARSAAPPPRNRVEQAARVGEQLQALDQALAAVGGKGVVAFEGPGLAAEGSRLGDVKDRNTVLSEPSEEVVLVGTNGTFSALSRKIREYRDEDTPSGKPKNVQLVARIEQMRLATLADLSAGEITEEDIQDLADYIVEIWLDGDGASGGEAEWSELVRESEPETLRVLSRYRGTDRIILLVALQGNILRSLPSKLSQLAEIHLPADVRLRDYSSQIDKLGSIPTVEPATREVVVAVHDTGVDSEHPLLKPVLLGASTAVPAGNPQDLNGHGTAMAGLAVYGDLSPQIPSGTLKPAASLVAVNFMQVGESGEVLWAERSALSVEIAEQIAGTDRTIHNFSWGAKNPREHEPTSWSSALDELAWNGGAGRLIVVSAGNTKPSALREDYPSQVLASQMTQPAQGWNVVTVNGSTFLDTLTQKDEELGYPAPAALSGQVSPYSTIGPARLVPIKPDVAAEAGNTAPDGLSANMSTNGLSLVTTARRRIGVSIGKTNATSAAAALTTNALARLWSQYPDLNPASIRGLLAHSAEMPAPAMSQLGPLDARRAMGHGVPALGRALFSDYGRPVMVHEGFIRPGRRGLDKRTKREVAYIRLPFPVAQLRGLGDESAELRITLSYFVEPSQRLRRSTYAGARLRWELQGPNESEADFRARVNVLSRDTSHAGDTGSTYRWAVGADGRSRGSLQRDAVSDASASFAGDRLVAVYPVLGWWNGRPDFEGRALPFSLIASLTLADESVDIYSEIQNEIEALVDSVDVDVTGSVEVD